MIESRFPLEEVFADLFFCLERGGAGRASKPHPADNGNAPANGTIPISAWRNARPNPDRYRAAVPPSPATGSVQTENRRMQALRAAA